MTERLKPLSEVTRLSDSVIRVLGGNPGKFTLQGTNTYLISPVRPSSPSSSSSAPIQTVLVDTGEGFESYALLLQAVLDGKDARAGASQRWISDIILTHRHHDHVGGLPSVLEMLSRRRPPAPSAPKLHKFPDPASDSILLDQLRKLPTDRVAPYSGSDVASPIRPLKHGDTIDVGDVTLQTVHSPGHTADHICILHRSERALLTGDHVLGQGTTVFEDLASYLSSLRTCEQLLTEAGPSHIDEVEGGLSEKSETRKNDENRLYPAHGPIIENGKATLREYTRHRMERETQIVELLTKPSPDDEGEQRQGTSDAIQGSKGESSNSQWTIKSLVSDLYKSYPEHLYPAAARGLFLHLSKLAQPDKDFEGVTSSNGARVECVGHSVVPRMPQSEGEWLQLMESRWRLLGDKLEQTQKESL